ncbi:MAG: hypothetical protein EPN20_07470 [Magnetospirillum sp.]|nr:MAG: hypothetical protein EPN20_07470 [Magnetospirillum sp.]
MLTPVERDLLVSMCERLIPVLGPMLQVAINETIPNIRLERIEAYLLRLSDQIEGIRLSAALQSPEGLDLFEERMWQAARARGNERLGNIAALVAIGLKPEDSRHGQPFW